jgi:hypothetical protein
VTLLPCHLQGVALLHSPDCRPHGPLSGAAKHAAGARPSKCVIILIDESALLEANVPAVL